MKKNIFSALLFLNMILSAAACFAADLSVDEIVARGNKVAYYEGNDGSAQVKMTITDAQGRVRNREFQILRLNIEDGGAQKYYVYFKEPADVRDMVYMVWKYIDRDDDRWMYLPALDLVRRIAASDKRSSFVGSNFVYEDISGRSLDLDKHELVGEENGLYKIKNTPKDTQDVEFAYFYVYIDKTNFMPMRAEYYNNQDKLIKTIEALEVKDVSGYPTVMKSKAADIETGSNTVMQFGDVQYDIGLQDDIFTERYLRRPPRKWLK